VSVILPARNAARVLPQQLDALGRQTYSGPWEVVVADHESSDDSATIAGAYSGRLPLRIVTVRGARGPGGARNAAARVARGDLLLFCDADDVVCADWVESMARGAPEVDIVGGRLDEETLNSAAVRAWRPPQQPEATLARPDGFLPFAPSCNMAIWADAFWSLGGFSERETHEDVELSWRAQLAGFRIGFAPDAVVAYRHRSSLRELARQSYRYGRGSVALYVQYRERGLRRERLRVVLGSWRRLVTRIPVRSDASSRGAYVRDASFRLGRLVGSLRHRVGYL